MHAFPEKSPDSRFTTLPPRASHLKEKSRDRSSLIHTFSPDTDSDMIAITMDTIDHSRTALYRLFIATSTVRQRPHERSHPAEERPAEQQVQHHDRRSAPVSSQHRHYARHHVQGEHHYHRSPHVTSSSSSARTCRPRTPPPPRRIC